MKQVAPKLAQVELRSYLFSAFMCIFLLRELTVSSLIIILDTGEILKFVSKCCLIVFLHFANRVNIAKVFSLYLICNDLNVSQHSTRIFLISTFNIRDLENKFEIYTAY